MERVQHGQYGCDADTRAHQHYGLRALLERELSARRRDLDAVADAGRGAQVWPAAPSGSTLTLIR
jgi:hypothetical protein